MHTSIPKFPYKFVYMITKVHVCVNMVTVSPSIQVQTSSVCKHMGLGNFKMVAKENNYEPPWSSIEFPYTMQVSEKQTQSDVHLTLKARRKQMTNLRLQNFEKISVQNCIILKIQN